MPAHGVPAVLKLVDFLALFNQTLVAHLVLGEERIMRVQTGGA